MGNFWSSVASRAEVSVDLDRAELRQVSLSLEDAARRQHVFSPDLLDAAMDVYREIRAGLKHHAPGDETYSVHRHLLAFSLWEAMNRKAMPRPPQMLAAAFDVSLKGFLKYEAHLAKGATYCAPAMYVPVIGRMLDAPYFWISAAFMLCRAYGRRVFGARPENVAAAGLLAVVHRAGEAETNEELTVQRVCGLVGASERAILTLRDRLLAFDFEMHPNRDCSSPFRFKFQAKGPLLTPAYELPSIGLP